MWCRLGWLGIISPALWGVPSVRFEGRFVSLQFHFQKENFMVLSIRNPQAEKLAREVAAESGESITQTIIQALEIVWNTFTAKEPRRIWRPR
jgi:hypothetical protein